MNETDNINDIDGLNYLKEYMQRIAEKKDNIKAKTEFIDIDNIEIEESNTETQQKVIRSLYSLNSAFSVTCIQSGYKATIAPLNYKDILSITDSNLSNYETKKEIYKTIYNRITSFSAAKINPSFDQWLSMTSYGDLETLFYGLYCSTFPDDSTVTYTCPYCGKENRINIKNKNLIKLSEREKIVKRNEEISKNVIDANSIAKYSLVTNLKQNKTSVKLPDSKFIFTIKLPTLKTVLDFLKDNKEEVVANAKVDEINILLSTVNILIFNEETKKYSYIENKSDWLPLIGCLSVNDIQILKSLVEEKNDSRF